MNRHCHRLVFNPLRNLLMPVAECATAWQGQHHLRARTSQPRTCWAWQPLALAILLLGLPAVALAQILADPAAPAGQRPTILNSASGAVQINIQTPTAGGVSMNQYRQFDTTTPVTIFNNGRSASQTQSAGWVAGNPWLAGGSAKVIVNQINSANPSRLSGTMEIAGARADLIIANPSGLRIDGVTVLNANRSTFATATPQLVGGVVQGFQTGNGLLQINGAGLNDSGSDYTTILARAVQLNAGLWAQQLQLTTGQNQLDATGKLIATTTPAAGSGGAAPAYSLDVAAVGGMYAGKITLLATEHGLGARNAGELVASQGDLQLHLDGRLENTGRMLAQQGGSMQLQSQQLDNDGTLSASHNLHIATGPLTNSGLINAGRELLLDASDISNTASGNISGQRLQIDAASLDNAGQLSQTGQQGLTVQANALHSSGVVGLPPKVGTTPELPSTPDDGATTPPATDSTRAPGGDAPVYSQPVPAQTLPDGTLHVAGLLDNSGSLLANGGIDLSLQQGLQNHGSMQLRTLQLFGPLLDNRQGQLYVDQALIDTGAIHNQDGTLVAGKDMTLRTATLDNGLGNIAAGGELRLLAGQLDNRAGWLEAAGLLFNGGDIDNRQGGIFARDISANSGMVNNTGGLLAASQSLLLDTGGQALWNGDSGDARGVLSGGKLALNSGDLFNLQDGRIQASTLDINSSTLRNQGGLIMGDTLTLSSNTLDNQAGLIAAKSSLTLAAAQSLHNQGELLSLGDAALHADTLQQQGGQTSANGNLAIQARQLASTGQFVAGQDLTLNSQQDLTVQAAIQAGRNLALSTAGKLDNQSSLRAGGSASIQADSISNASQADISASTLNLQATTSLDNQGLIDAGDASIQAGETISNRGSGRIYADRLLLAAPKLDNTPLAGQAAVIAARQQLGIAADQLRNGENAQLISLGDMVIGGGFDSSGQISRPASLVDNQSASIDAAGNMQISADTVRNQRLRVGITHLNAGDSISLSSGGDTTLKGAVVAAPSVQAKVGGHLSIESLQDQDHYDSKQNSLGGSLTFGAGMMGGSLSMSQSKINSDYLSVGEQSGILAGDGGFHVKVAGDTTLTGGVISSTETAVQQQNNQFETGGQLAMTDLHNQADYNASSTSLNIGTSMNQQGMWSPSGSGVGFGNDSGSASSDTRSGISGIAGNSAARTGDPQSGIQRIFDADKVQQDIDAQTLITQTFGQQASSAVGKYAEKKMETATALTEQANQARANGQNDLADQLSAQASQINSEWGENGSYRIGLHTVIGGLTGGATGVAGSLTGSLTAAETMRLLQESGITQENNPALYNTLVTLASTAAGGVVGGTAGAGTAFNEVTNNDLQHKVKAIAEGLKGCSSQKCREELGNALKDVIDNEIKESRYTVVDSTNETRLPENWNNGMNGILTQRPSTNSFFVQYGMHAPVSLGLALGGNVSFNEKGQLSVTPELSVATIFDAGFSFGFSGDSRYSGVGSINVGQGKYLGIQVTPSNTRAWASKSWYDASRYINGISFGLGVGLSAPISGTIDISGSVGGYKRD